MLKPFSPSDAARFREWLREAGYSQAGLRGILHSNEMPSHARRNLPRLLDLASEASRLHTLVRLFTVGAGVSGDAARRFLPEWVIASCLQHGLLAPDGGGLKPAVTLLPFKELILATDLALDISCHSARDVVLGVNASTWLLDHFTARRRSRATLDLGAGCGVHALSAAAHSEAVVASDLNPRATCYATFNARLNGLESVKCVTGDTFAPVAGRRFDLILGNPPFFITPRLLHLYCDNSMDLDQYCTRILREAPAYLEKGGVLQMLCEWAQVAGQPWEERVAGWLDGIGCDAWVLRLQTHDPCKYAQDRIRDTTPPSPEADSANYAEWTEYYRARGVEAIHTGMIAMRRREGPNWIRIEDLPRSPADPFGDLVLRIFAARDFLETHPADTDLLGATPRLCAGAQLVQRLRLSGQDWHPDSIHLAMPGGAPFTQQLEPLVADFVCLLDGSRSLQERIREFAGRVRAEPEQVERECLGVVRRLIERGFLEV